MTMTKAQAAELQGVLIGKGYDLGPTGADGDYGPKTHAANLAAVQASTALAHAHAGRLLDDDVWSVFTPQERKALTKAHADLVRVLARARRNGARFRIDTVERSEGEQRKAVQAGNSQTMDSRHLPSKETGKVHAVDLYPLDDVDHDQVPWDWDDFYPLAEQLRAAGQQELVPLRWGGCWDVRWTDQAGSAKAAVAAYTQRRKAAGAKKILLDGPHFELPAALYP